MSLSASEGKGFLYEGNQTVFPPGYPWMVSLLYLRGWASPASLALLNLFLLGIGVTSLASLVRNTFGFSKVGTLLLCELFLLNWVMVKHTSLPLTDIPFFGAAMLSILLCERARTADSDRLAVVIFASAWAFILAAIGIRRPGIALLPALAWAVATRPRWVMRYSSSPVWTRTWVCGLLASAALVSGFWIYATSTLMDYPSIHLGRVVELLLSIINYRLTELGEIAVNIPTAKLPMLIRPIVTITGVATVGLVSFGLLARRRVGTVEIFVLSYVGIVILWPYFDSRFLIPVLPFLLIYGFLGIRNIRLRDGGWRIELVVPVILHILIGAVALTYNARISLSRDKFPELFGDGSLRTTYCYYLKSCSVDDVEDVNRSALRLLRAFSQ
jgi:hypothetical protein